MNARHRVWAAAVMAALVLAGVPPAAATVSGEAPA